MKTKKNLLIIQLILFLSFTSFGSFTKDIKYVASAKSNVYHYTHCKWAKRISSKNLVIFNSVEEASKKGYRPCKVCKPPLETLDNDSTKTN